MTQYPGPDGWVGYTDWQCNGCRLYVPASKASLPPPIAWEKCGASPGGIDCQSMVIDWTKDELAVAPGLFDVSSQGPVLSVQRNSLDAVPPYITHVVADADGPVRSAIYAMKTTTAASTGCFAYRYAINEGKFVFLVLGHDAYGKWANSPHQGAIGGPIDEAAPHVLADFGEADSWACSSARIYRVTPGFELLAYNWNMSGEQLVGSQASDPEGLQFKQLVPHGEALFWTSSNLYATGINSWTTKDGSKPLIRFVGDATRGAGNLGTDGTTLVWSYGEGKQPNDFTVTYPKRSVMTAAFTTDPGQIAATRLRSDPNIYVNGAPFQVACGRAAHGGSKQPVLIVRLADGVSWQLPPATPPTFDADAVLGLTCDHVYLYGQFGGRYNIARIRLDSLGPGIPPD